MSNAIEHNDEPRWAGLQEVIRMAGPAIISQLSWVVMQLIDTAMVSRLGMDQLAAVGSSGLWCWVVVSFFFGLLSCVSTFVAQSFGKGDTALCASYAWQAIYFSFATAVVGVLLWPLSRPFFESMGHDPAVCEYEIQYFQTRLIGFFLIPWQAALAGFFMGINRPKIAMAVTVPANLLNIVLGYALIFGAFGFPRLEVRGAAVALLVSLLFQCLLLQAIFLAPSMRSEFGTWAARAFHWHRMKELLGIGWGAGTTWLLDVITWGVFTSFIVGHSGAVALAAHNAAIAIMQVSFQIAIGLNHAIAAIVGQWVGRGNIARAKARTYTATRLAMGYMFVMGIVFAWFGQNLLVVAFHATPEVARLGHWLLMMAAVFQGFDAMTIVVSGALRGAGDTKWQAIVMGIAAYFVFLPLAFILGRVFDFGALGAWVGATIYIIAISGVFMHRFVGERWRHINIFREKAPSVPESLPNESESTL